MPEIQHDLLDERLLSVRVGGEVGQATFPEVLARLSAGEDLDFPVLRPHQQHAWHAFLVQLAALTLHRAELDDPPKRPEQWRSMILDLTNGAREPWCLVVEDLAEPAFFQPPVPEGSLAKFNSADTPDGIDVLVTTRNHDLKKERIRAARPEHWIFAVISLQTMEGYTGKKHYGIVRMNSGSGSRAGLSWRRDWDRSTSFRDDLRTWITIRERLIAEHGYKPEGGIELMWTVPWDGASTLALQELDPFFLEICRRLRLETTRQGLRARWAPTECTRVDQAEWKGATGDIWSPVRVEDGAVLSLSGGGFSYKLLSELLLTGTYRTTAVDGVAEERRREAGWVEAQGLARGQKTEGYHERRIPVPPKVRSLLRKPDDRERLAKLAQERIEVVTEVWKKALRYGIAALLQDGAEKYKFDDKRLRPWSQRLDSAVDPIFFPRLWDAVAEGGGDAAKVRWSQEVLAEARAILEEAIDSIPVASARKLRAVANAERLFGGASRRMLSGFETVAGDEPKEKGERD